MAGKISELTSRLTAALAARTHKLEILDAGDPTMAASGTNKHMMLEDVVGYVQANTAMWDNYIGVSSYPNPRDPGRPFQTVWNGRYREIREWRPNGLQWNATGAHLRCDLLTPIPSTDYEVTFYSAPQWAANGTTGIILNLGSTSQSITQGGFMNIADAPPAGGENGLLRCGGAISNIGPLDCRLVRFGRWDGLCHVQSNGADVTSATNNTSWDGTGPIYIGGFPAGQSWGANSAAYSFVIRQRSTGKVLASWDSTIMGTISAGKTWADPQGNTWTQVGTPLQTVITAQWVTVGNTGHKTYYAGVNVIADQPSPENGTLAFEVNMGNLGSLVFANGWQWIPVGVPIFANATQRDTYITTAQLNGTIPNGIQCITVDDNVLWQYVGGAWVNRTLKTSGLEAAKIATPTASPGLEYYATDTKRLWLWDGTGWIIMREPVQTYTPTPTGGVTLGNGVLVGQYKRRGGLCWTRMRLTLGSTTVITGTPQLPLPFAADNSAFDLTYKMGSIFDFTGAQYTALLQGSGNNVNIQYLSVSGSATILGVVSATAPMTWAVSDYMSASFEYLMSSIYS